MANEKIEKLYEYCQNLKDCVNYDPIRDRSTHLYDEENESQITGFCSYCRKKKNKALNPNAVELPSDIDSFYIDGDHAVSPREEDSEPIGQHYEDYVAIEDADGEFSKYVQEELPAEPFPDAFLDMKPSSKQIAEKNSSRENLEDKAAVKKNNKDALKDLKKRSSRDRPLSEIERKPKSKLQKNKNLSFDEADNFTGNESEVTDFSNEISAPAESPAIIEAPSLVPEQSGEPVKNSIPERIGPSYADRLKIMMESIVLFFKGISRSQLDGVEKISQPLSVRRPHMSFRDYWDKISLILMEGALGVFDLGSSTGRIAISAAGVGLQLVGGALSVSGGILKGALLMVIAPQKAASSFFGVFPNAWKSLSGSYDSLKSGVRPFVDGRIVPASSVAITSAGLVSTIAHVSMAASATMLTVGPAMAVGWVGFRAVRAAVTGKVFFGTPIPFKSFFIKRQLNTSLRSAYKNPIWTNTHRPDKNADISLHERDYLNKLWTETNHRFEKATGDVFSRLNYAVKLNGTKFARENGHKGSGDGGEDVFAWDSRNRLYVISCKRHSAPCPIKEVRDISAVAKSDKYRDIGGATPILVTTIGFTKDAREWAEANGVYLYTLDELIEMTIL